MNPSKQAENYDKIASHWASDNFNLENGIEQHKRALQFSQNKESAIDVGCGSSGRIIEILLNDGFSVEGLDLSSEMLNIAQQKHPDVKFHHADICKWDFPKKYDFISAWDSVWHAPLEEQAKILKKLCDALTPNGVLIYTSGAVDEPGDGSNEFLGQLLYHAAIGIPAILEIINECNCICRHLENDDWPNRHLYLVIQKKDA
ncbi:MAG: class I SAM-dependent methyltransferase [Colwellia sp.]|nr:class I SAM-dependent methyltransferase [Colwellia sp.]